MTKQVFVGRPEPFAAGLWISSAMPKTPAGEPTRKDRMIIIRDDSGNQMDLVRENARIGVQFWGSTKAEASDLAQLGRGLMNDMVGGPIKRIRNVLRPVFIEDVQPMFYATFELIVKGSKL
ncbi:hypothetical protein [Arthrobacter sp. Bi26]|uniref:hypothetical protein n=1 Tax=Arthrobacter sp. Bi26 TaxID=2822350 RepID=UPI001E566F60|nr:hypothetical protein [Arthrobacter sp. Bi26]